MWGSGDVSISIRPSERTRRAPIDTVNYARAHSLDEAAALEKSLKEQGEAFLEKGGEIHLAP